MTRATVLLGIFLGALALQGSTALAQTSTPGPAVYGYRYNINDLFLGTTPVDQPLTTTDAPIEQSANYTTGVLGVDVSTESTITVLGAPLTRARVQASATGSGFGSGVASASISYQIVITGPGNPGDLVDVSFATFGSQVHTSPCAICLATSLSSSALLRVSDASNDYFLLGEEVVGNGDDTLFFSGIGTQPISVVKTLALPIETLINVNLATTAFGDTLGLPTVAPPNDLVVTATLDPTFTPLDSQYTVLVSSNLGQPPQVPSMRLFGLALLLVLLTGIAVFPRQRA